MGRVYGIVAALVVATAAFLALACSGGSADAKPRLTIGNDSFALKVLRLAVDTEPATLDPIGITDTISDGVARKLHNCLVRFEKRGDVLAVVPDLAESFDVSPDGKLYTFTLRRGVKFHNGREMKAADVVYSLARLLTPESKRPEWLKPFVAGSEARYKDGQSPLGIKAENDYVVTIELEQAFAPFIQHLCTVNCAVVPREAVERPGIPFARKPVGVGAFSLKEWRDNEVLVLARNADYFKGRPKLDAVRFYIMKEPMTRLENFFAGNLDAASIPYGHVKKSIARAGAENVLAYDTFRTNYLGIGFPNGDFKDRPELRPFGTNKLLRQALSYALDREYLCQTVLEGRGIPARGVLPPGMPGYKFGRPGWPRDLDKARALLAQAGYPNGAGLPPITILHRNDPDTKRMAQVIAYDFEQIGLRIELQAREWNSFLEMVEREPRQMFLLGWVADYPDPDNFLYVLFHSKQWGSAGNHTWYANRAVDALTEKARAVTGMSDRVPLYHQAEDIILDESTWICTYHVRNMVLLNKQVKGLRENVTPLDTGTEFPQVDFALVDVER